MWKSPNFWWQSQPSLLSRLLRPVSFLYGVMACRRQTRGLKTAVQAPVPVISIGNIVMGGAGKTPVTLALSALLRSKGLHPNVLVRGYGGTVSGPLWVDPDKNSFAEVGDEALLLARHVPTLVARRRAAGLSLLTPKQMANPQAVLLLDDGHQHTSLHKDISFVVMDENQRNGNGELFPAGPLREPLQVGLARADAVIWIGRKAPTLSLPVFQASFSAECSLKAGEKVLGFAGLGYPLKFQKTLEALQLDVVEFCSFPDHFPYTERDLQLLVERARQQKATLVTTEKDLVRLPKAFQEKVFCAKINVVWDNSQAIWDFIRKKL